MRTRKKLLLLFLPVLMLVINCAATQNIAVPDRSRTFSYPYDVVFDTVTDCVQNKGYFLRNLDRENGIIDTDYKTGGFWESLFGSNFRSKIGVNLSELEDGRTYVVLMIVREDRDDDEGWSAELSPKGMSMKYYTEFFSELEDALYDTR